MLLRLTLAVAGVCAFATVAIAEDTTKGAPKPPPSQSQYTPKEKTGSESPAKPAPPATDKNGGTVTDKSGK